MYQWFLSDETAVLTTRPSPRQKTLQVTELDDKSLVRAAIPVSDQSERSRQLRPCNAVSKVEKCSLIWFVDSFFLRLNLITFQNLNLNEVAELQPAETTRWNEQERFWNERRKQKKNSRSKRDSLISRSRLTIIIIIAIIIISIASYFLLFLFFFDVSKCVEDTCGKHQLKIVSELWLKKYSC